MIQMKRGIMFMCILLFTLFVSISYAEWAQWVVYEAYKTDQTYNVTFDRGMMTIGYFTEDAIDTHIRATKLHFTSKVDTKEDCLVSLQDRHSTLAKYDDNYNIVTIDMSWHFASMVYCDKGTVMPETPQIVGTLIWDDGHTETTSNLAEVTGEPYFTSGSSLRVENPSLGQIKLVDTGIATHLDSLEWCIDVYVQFKAEKAFLTGFLYIADTVLRPGGAEGEYGMASNLQKLNDTITLMSTEVLTEDNKYLYRFRFDQYAINKSLYNGQINPIQLAFETKKYGAIGYTTDIGSSEKYSYSTIARPVHIPFLDMITLRLTGVLDSMKIIALPTDDSRQFKIAVNHVENDKSWVATVIAHVSFYYTQGYRYEENIIIPISSSGPTTSVYNISLDSIAEDIARKPKSSKLYYKIRDIQFSIKLKGSLDNTVTELPQPLSIQAKHEPLTSQICLYPWSLDCSINHQETCLVDNTLWWYDPAHPKDLLGTCVCHSGYVGINCQQPKQCESEWNKEFQCYNNGIIVFNKERGSCDESCSCYDKNNQRAYTGYQCRQDKRCEGEYNILNQCNHHGYIPFVDNGDNNQTSINNTTCSSSCLCDKSWVGDDCSQTTDCALAKASFSGTCPEGQVIHAIKDEKTQVCTASCVCASIGSSSGSSSSSSSSSNDKSDTHNNTNRICSGHGYYPINIDDGTCDTSKCYCFGDNIWSGDICQYPSLCDNLYMKLNECSGNGIVELSEQDDKKCNDICTCNGTWAGDDCSQTTDCNIAIDILGPCPADQVLDTKIDEETLICTVSCLKPIDDSDDSDDGNGDDDDGNGDDDDDGNGDDDDDGNGDDDDGNGDGGGDDGDDDGNGDDDDNQATEKNFGSIHNAINALIACVLVVFCAILA